MWVSCCFKLTFASLLRQGNTQYMWTGDRWQSAPDHLKDHDFQYWSLLVFNDSEPQPSIQPFGHFVDSFNVTVG